jgi:hypothetical protein
VEEEDTKTTERRLISAANFVLPIISLSTTLMMLTITIRMAIAFLARTGHSAPLVSATVVLARLANICTKLATKRPSAEIACRDE